MRITDLRCVVYEGESYYDGPYYGDRQVRPTDIYETFRSSEWGKEDNLPIELETGKLAITGRFLYVDTDEGISGLFGPIGLAPALLALQMKSLIIGLDPLATNMVWDVLYRAAIHGRKGTPMLAISAIDCALWDLKGKVVGQPLYRLLGGPTRREMAAYVSALAYPVDPQSVTAQARSFVDQGYCGQKWFFRHGPGEGKVGFAKNLALVEAARAGAGEDCALMFDAWNSWDVPYTLDFAAAAARWNPAWIEEPVLPDMIDQMAEITRRSPVRIAGGEHEYTRWGFLDLLQRQALNIVQADPMWCGGITEMISICALASAYGKTVIPHGESIAVCAHIVASQPPDLCPLVENLEKFNVGWQHFLIDPVKPVSGKIKLDDRHGLGLVIDESKVRRQTLLG
ncbi:mandelate racemase/muconate lactonizing protein [Ensifer sp. ENS06]|uniref:enolase C-terminal domain-like protein n=1 Tax=Ensifer sp. ENS06 TaxID=2769276 RepID=UPI001784C23E|nr:enolase C-terminal domain-like protein [Ensifer sp. ENS06]MBD9626988.1 mandelate racemase/muconate lactonizing protein [Ensifer sp. ENS06]